MRRFNRKFFDFLNYDSFFNSSSLYLNHLDPFYNDLDNYDNFFGDFQDISQPSTGVNTRSNQGRNLSHDFTINSNSPNSSCFSRSFVSKSTYDGTGEPKKEVFQQETYSKVDEKGKKIKESKAAYENTYKGIQKAAHEKVIDEKGHRIVKEKNLNTGDDLEEVYYKGINQDDLENFNKEYIEFKDKVKFDKYKKMLVDEEDERRGNKRNIGNKYLGPVLKKTNEK